MLRRLNTRFGKNRAIRGNLMDTLARRRRKLIDESISNLAYDLPGVALPVHLVKRAHKGVKKGYKDRMEQRVGGYMESEAPASVPNLKKGVDLVAPTTSTGVDKNIKSPAGKLKKGGKGVYKGKKPFATVGPKKALKPKETSAKVAKPMLTKEQMIANRAMEYRQGMAGISMVKQPTTGAIPALAVKKSPQKAQESKEALIGNLLEKKFRYESEARAKARLGSKADITLRKGTGVKHTFRTNDKKHQFYGRPLSMRQKLLAEHKRKGFALPEDFANLDPVSIGKHFDYLSDQGMLEKRKNLDPSNWNYLKRKIKRNYRRGKKKVLNFYKGILKRFQESSNIEESNAFEPVAKISEANTDACDFELGNVKYPEDCECSRCKEMLETASSSFGANIRGGTQGEPAITERVKQVPDDLIMKVFARRLYRAKRKKRMMLVRESLEDLRREQFLNDEIELHRRNPEPRGLMKRRNSYFNLSGNLRKLDKLGHGLAVTAAVMNALPKAAGKIIFGMGKGMAKNASKAANYIKKTAF